ncbi:MAG: S41 family peptidase [Tyzzerella sp.]|nr:S41 family peptidase [Tyzzerella sp.]
MDEKKNFWKGALCGALAVLIVVGIVGGSLILFLPSKKKDDGIVAQATEEKLKTIQSIIDDIYLYDDEIDESALQEAIIDGYVAGLNEPYTVYYNEEETTALFESTSGVFGGIGVQISQDITSMIMTFVKVYESNPGDKAGFLDGDILYKVNGEDVTGQELDTVVTKIRGEVGTEVEITVLRGDNLEEYTATVTRDLIENDTVNYEMKEKRIGYVAISGFEEVTYAQFEDALTQLKSQGMQSLIIDLRGNPGGNLSTVVEMCDLILPEGTIVSVKDRNGNGQFYTSDEENKLEVPLVVLIDGNSASASEIFAGAVKDFGIGTLVGTTTYGKGIVQNIYQLDDGTSLKITSSEYFTPNGTNIHGIGVAPDVEIPYEYDENNPEADNQLDKAIEILKNGM